MSTKNTDKEKDSNQEGRDERGRFKNPFLLNMSKNFRPPIYENEQELVEKLGEYIEYEDKTNKQGAGKGKYTIEGAALFLGFASRQSMYDYEKKNDQFSYIITRFKLFMSDWNVKKLYWGGTMPGAMFWLKNHGGYTDEVIQHQKQEITNVTITEKKRDA